MSALRRARKTKKKIHKKQKNVDDSPVSHSLDQLTALHKLFEAGMTVRVVRICKRGHGVGA